MKNIRDGSLYKALFDAAADGIIIINNRGIIQSFSPSAEKLFGYSASEIEGQNVSILMPPEHGIKHDGYLENYIQTGSAAIIGRGREVTALKKNGQRFQMHLSIGETKDKQGEAYFVGICHDLSNYRAVINQLDIVDKRYRSVFDSDGLFIVCIETNGFLSLANKSFSKSFFIDENQARNFLDCVAESSSDDAKRLLRMSEDKALNEIKTTLKMASQPDVSEVEWWFRLVEDNEGQHIQGVGIDVSEKVSASNEAFFLKNYDSVTNLPLQDHFIELLEKEYKPSSQYCFMTFELVDYDRLCLLNGDRQVDSTLRKIARILERKPLFSQACRLFASRFLVVFTSDDETTSSEFLQQEIYHLQQTLKLEIGAINSEIRVGVSCTSHIKKQLIGLSGFVEQANQAVEYAKARSLLMAVYNEHIRLAQEHKSRVRKGLLRAISEGELTIHFQPKVGLGNGAIVGYEALLRWFSPVCGSISPLEIIETAQELNLMHELDVYVINKTLMIMSMYETVFTADTPVSINISARNFVRDSVIERLVVGCQEKGVDPAAVEVEVTEDAIISIGDVVKENSHILKETGIKICLDDFGTGYSALSYLGKLPLDNLKIDRSFVKEVNQPNGFLMLQAIVSIAKAYNLTVTAEGIEDESQEMKLAELGCDFGQGFFYSKALPVEELVEWLKEYEQEAKSKFA